MPTSLRRQEFLSNERPERDGTKSTVLVTSPSTMTASMSEEPGSPQSFNELKLQESEFGASGEIHVPTHPRSHPPRADLRR